MQIFVNYRLRNNRLPVETGSWIKNYRNLRKCNLCNDNDVGDEFHFIYRCSFFDEERKITVPFIKKREASSVTFYNLFNEMNQTKLRKTCKFLGIILKQFRTVPG